MKCVIEIQLTDATTKIDVLTESLLGLVAWCDRHTLTPEILRKKEMAITDSSGKVTGFFKFVS